MESVLYIDNCRAARVRRGTRLNWMVLSDKLMRTSWTIGKTGHSLEAVGETSSLCSKHCHWHRRVGWPAWTPVYVLCCARVSVIGSLR